MAFTKFSNTSLTSIPEIVSSLGCQLIFVAQKPTIGAESFKFRRIATLPQIAFGGVWLTSFYNQTIMACCHNS